MADDARREREADMTEEEILSVFAALKLPAAPPAPPPAAPNQTQIFFPIVGNTVPLKTG